MGDQTRIEWTDSTFNPWIGCTKVGPGCDHCYAEADWDLRKHRVSWGTGQPRSRTSAANWRRVMQWDSRPFYTCPGCGWRGDNAMNRPRCPTCDDTAGLLPARRRVFCASLADVFDNEVPDDWRNDLFALIYATPDLDWILVTKRIGNVERMTAGSVAWEAARHRITLLATVCNQAEASRDIPKLLATTAGHRGLSVEPLLSPIDLSDVLELGGLDTRLGLSNPGLDWVIVGGESGPHARPMHPDWVRSLRDQCVAARVPFLFKQWGEFSGAEGLVATRRQWVMIDDAGRTLAEAGSTARMGPITHVARVGKKAAGRLLDGRTWDQYPLPQETTR